MIWEIVWICTSFFILHTRHPSFKICSNLHLHLPSWFVSSNRDSDKEDVKLSCLPSAKSIHKSIRNGIKLQTKNPLKSSDEEDEEDSELAQEIRNLASQVGIENVLEDEYISGKFAAVLRLVKMVPKGDKTIVFVSPIRFVSVFISGMEGGLLMSCLIIISPYSPLSWTNLRSC